MEVDRRVGGDSVEGQNASRTVHIHSYSVRDGGGRGQQGRLRFIVIHKVRIVFGASQSPGLIVPSKPAVSSVSSPGHSPFSHRYVNSASPLHLPVTATGQSSLAQQLFPEVEPVRGPPPRCRGRGRRVVVGQRHRPVVVGQLDGSVDRVCVHSEFTGI